MSITTILIIVLIIVLIGGAPNWGLHDRGWGPSGGIGFLLVVILILYLLKVI